jgi:NAD(P)-dependent dehydrogenase (short-subunit alcohol dehydrogenase family)
VVRAFAARGDGVALFARGEGGLAAARQEVLDLGAEAVAVPVDMADPQAVAAAAEQVEKELGPVDVWVNDAFTSVFAPFMEIEPDEFRRVTEVTYLGYVYATRAALERMLPGQDLRPDAQVITVVVLGVTAGAVVAQEPCPAWWLGRPKSLGAPPGDRL